MPTPIPASSSRAGGPAPAASASSSSASGTILQKLDLMIWLTLSAWPALALAVQNSWGGADTGAKRDWFAGAVSELLADTPEADLDPAYVEEFLLQVMQDEFEVVVDDGSPAEVAEQLLERRAKIRKGEFQEVDTLFQRYEAGRAKGEKERVNVRFVKQQRREGDEEDEDEDSDSESGSDDDGGVDVDVDMDDAPEVVPPKEKRKPPPEVDDDGFTKVVSRRR